MLLLSLPKNNVCRRYLVDSLIKNDGFVENHENGQVIQFLFLDAHVDHIRRSQADHGDEDIMDPLSN